MKHNTPAQEVKSLETLFFTFFKIGLSPSAAATP